MENLQGNESGLDPQKALLLHIDALMDQEMSLGQPIDVALLSLKRMVQRGPKEMA